MNQLISLYNQLLSIFPSYLHFWISLILFLAIVFWILDLMKRNILWLVLLVVFLPASIPILRQIFMGLLGFLKFLLGKVGA